MDQGPLVMQQIEAGEKFIQEFAKCMPLRAAFWLKDAEEKEWYLYVASDQIKDSTGPAYGEVARITAGMRGPWFNGLEVKVIGADKPLAKAVVELQQKYKPNEPNRYRTLPLGGMYVEEIYIYPLPVAVPN